MTINIALVTSEALVLGCDSIASMTEWFLPAFGPKSVFADDGTISAQFSLRDVVSQVTNTWGGVTKMFCLHGNTTPVAAVTAGLAKLNDRTMSSLAHEFLTGQQAVGFPMTAVETVANAFLVFLRAHYDQHYLNSDIPEQYREGPHFLVGGYGANEHLPSLYRIHVESNRVIPQFPVGETRYGIAWDGQSDAVERLIRGYDSNVRAAIENAVSEEMGRTRQSMAEAMAAFVQQLVNKVGADTIGDMNFELPAPADIKLGWDGFQARVMYGNLPTQDAVDFAAYLVNLQSGRAKFGEGVATVGGRTHIGVVTKQSGFRMIDEPELTHRSTGFL